MTMPMGAKSPAPRKTRSVLVDRKDVLRPMTPRDETADAAVDSLKSAVLLSRELAMMSTAVKYDVDKRADRVRSRRDLVRLFFKLVNLSDVDLFVEAGAKEASASRRVKKALPDARVVAFEGNPYTHRKFVPDNAEADVEYLNLALSDHPGPITFNVLRDEQGAPRSDGQSSLLKRQRSEQDALRGFDEVTVQGVTLDGFFEGHGFERAAIWMDVEGACKFVLGGGADLLSRTAVMMVEVETRKYWGEDHWLQDQVVAHLYDYGLVPVARDFEFVFQYNIVFVRADTLATNERLGWALTRFASLAVPGSLNTPGSESRKALPVARSAAPRLRALSRRLRPR